MWLLLGAFLLAAVALAAGYVAFRRMGDAEQRSYIDELDDHAYDVDLDTPQRLEYFALLDAAKEGKASANVLMVGLLNRAAAALPFVEMVERDRPRLHKLHRHSYVPTSVLDELVVSEHELQAEVEDVRAEAERLKPGWGREIFSQAWHIARKRRAEAAHAAAVGRAQRGAGSWSQSATHLSLGLPLPLGIRQEHLIVNFEPQACTIIVGSHNPRRLELEQPVRPDDCSWSIGEDGLQIVLAKLAPAMWKGPHKAASAS